MLDYNLKVINIIRQLHCHVQETVVLLLSHGVTSGSPKILICYQACTVPNYDHTVPAPSDGPTRVACRVLEILVVFTTASKREGNSYEGLTEPVLLCLNLDT